MDGNNNRPVVTCGHCGIVQFQRANGICCRCRKQCHREWEVLRAEQNQKIKLVLRKRLAKRLKQNSGRNLHDMFGLLMSVFRKAEGLTQREFGDRVGAHAHWVHNSERSLNEWTAKRIERAAQAVGIPAWVYVEFAMIALGHGSGVLHGEAGEFRRSTQRTDEKRAGRRLDGRAAGVDPGVLRLDLGEVSESQSPARSAAGGELSGRVQKRGKGKGRMLDLSVLDPRLKDGYDGDMQQGRIIQFPLFAYRKQDAREG